MRISISSFIYNQIGHFAAAAEGICKALFLGGVTRRFPTLKFAFKEGGVGWAVNLYCALYERWHKRSLPMMEQVNPANLDTELYRKLCAEYGGKFTRGRLKGIWFPRNSRAVAASTRRIATNGVIVESKLATTFTIDSCRTSSLAARATTA